MSFVQCHKWPSPGAGLHQIAQLWNPVGSGVNLKVSRIIMHSNSKNSFNVIATDTQFSELRNAGHSTTIDGNGSAVAKGQLRGATNSHSGAYQKYSLYVVGTQAGEQVDMPVDITVAPGWGLAIVSRSQAEAMAACFEWTEQ